PLFRASHRCSPRSLHSVPTRRSSDLTHVDETVTRSTAFDGCAALVVGGAAAVAELAPQVQPVVGIPVQQRVEHVPGLLVQGLALDRKSTRLNSSHVKNLVCRLLLEKK